MEIRMFQKGFNYSQDGPGNRLVLHLSGCSMQCPWCSNPEGKSHTAGEAVPVDAVVQEVLSCRPMFFDGGGVTLTGGEVTEQFDAVKELLQKLKAEKISTCIETNGTSPRLPELFSLVDHLIMDCKHYDEGKHRAVLGIPLPTVRENLQKAASRQVAVRIPLIGGYNASKADAEKFADFFEALHLQNATMELLPYHEYGKDKYEKLGIPYPMTENARVAPMQVKEFADILQSRGFTIIKT